MSLPEVAILIPTYNRRKIVNQAVDQLQKNLKYEGQVLILIGDDSDERAGYAFDPAFVQQYPHGVFAYSKHERKGTRR
jgi:glycosyltransferase involved in cell wall biosynthesis